MIPEILIPNPDTWQGLLQCFAYSYILAAPVCYMVWKLDRLARKNKDKS